MGRLSGLMAVIGILASGQIAMAQNAPKPQLPLKGNPAVGTQCTHPNLRGFGVVKVDLCDRTYCGSRRFSEPFEKRPIDPRRFPCTFKVVDSICTCVAEKSR